MTRMLVVATALVLFAGSVVAQAPSAPPSCRDVVESRQLDFWIGEWDVATPDGKPAGQNSIQLILGQCVILENWTSRGFEGKSFNIYNRFSKKWEQTWVDSSGATRRFAGEIRDGVMQLVGENVGPDGKPRLIRIVLTRQDADHLRQVSHFSTDSGATWLPRYDLIYTRRK